MALFTIGFNPAIDRILECSGFHIGGHQKAHQIARLASGKAANVSRALAQLGVDSIATGFIGAADREFFHEQLLSVGPGRILCRFIDVGGKTRENITILDPKQHVETHIRDRGFSVTPEEVALLDHKIAHDVKPGDTVIFSGSVCQGLPFHYLAGLIDRCLNQQARIVVDSNGEALRQASTKQLWILKPNVDELRELLGTQVPNAALALRDAAKALLGNIENILISRGPLGALLLTRAGSFSARANTKEPPVRTVGCGDHLLAGFVHELASGRDPERALATGVAVATARAISAKLDEVDGELLRAILSEVTTEQI
jgi:1-phosphofructokinase